MDIVPTTCLCGHRASWPVSKTKDNLVTVQLCKVCGMGYAHNYPDAEFLEVYYRYVYRDRMEDTPEERWKKQVQNGREIKVWLQDTVRYPLTRILDVGCATGGMLAPFLGQALSCEGIDMNPSFLAYGQRIGVDVRPATLDEVTGEYSLILMRHVLEHVDNPMKTLKQCYHLLKMRGYIYVEVPYFYIERGVPQEQMLSHHKWHFRPETLRAALEGAGFMVVKEEQPNHLRILGMKNGTHGDGYRIPYTRRQIQQLYRQCRYYNLKTWARNLFFGR